MARTSHHVRGGGPRGQDQHDIMLRPGFRSHATWSVRRTSTAASPIRRASSRRPTCSACPSRNASSSRTRRPASRRRRRPGSRSWSSAAASRPETRGRRSRTTEARRGRVPRSRHPSRGASSGVVRPPLGDSGRGCRLRRRADQRTSRPTSWRQVPPLPRPSARRRSSIPWAGRPRATRDHVRRPRTCSKVSPGGAGPLRVRDPPRMPRRLTVDLNPFVLDSRTAGPGKTKLTRLPGDAPAPRAERDACCEGVRGGAAGDRCDERRRARQVASPDRLPTSETCHADAVDGGSRRTRRCGRPSGMHVPVRRPRGESAPRALPRCVLSNQLRCRASSGRRPALGVSWPDLRRDILASEDLGGRAQPDRGDRSGTRESSSALGKLRHGRRGTGMRVAGPAGRGVSPRAGRGRDASGPAPSSQVSLARMASDAMATSCRTDQRPAGGGARPSLLNPLRPGANR